MSDDAGQMNLGAEVSKGVAAKFVQAGLGFVGAIIFARVLGPTDFGGFYLIIAVAKIVDFPIDGWADGTKKRFSEADSPRSEIIRSQWLLNTVVLAITGGAAFLLADVFQSYTDVENAWLFFVLLLGAKVFFYPHQRLLSARGLVGLSTWNDTLRSVFTFGFQLGLVLLGFGVAGMAWGWVIATVLTIPVSLYYLREYLRPVLSFPSRETWRSIAEFAQYSTLNSIFGKAYSRYDVLLLGALLTPAAVAHYEVAYKLSVPAMFVSTVAGSGLMVKVSNLDSRGEAVAQDITNTLSFTSLLAVPLFFGALAMPVAIIRTVFGPEYTAAAPLLVGLTFYQLVYTRNSVFRRALEGVDRPDTVLKIVFVTLSFNVVAGFVLTLEFGAIGVVVATVAAGLLRYAMSAYLLAKTVGAQLVRNELGAVTLFPKLFRVQLVAGAVMFVAVFLLQRTVAVRSWLVLATLVGTGAVIYFLVLIVASKQFRNTALDIVESFGFDSHLPS